MKKDSIKQMIKQEQGAYILIKNDVSHENIGKFGDKISQFL